MRIRIILTLIIIIFFGDAYAQKGEKTISAGPLISFPTATRGVIARSELLPGLGLEAIGQYNFSDKSALLLKSTLASWGYRNQIYDDSKRLTFLTLQGGYKLNFGSGFFINGLVGADLELQDSFTTIAFTLGAGKRFVIMNDRFLDAGIDLVGGDSHARINFIVVFNLFRWSEEN